MDGGENTHLDQPGFLDFVFQQHGITPLQVLLLVSTDLQSEDGSPALEVFNIERGRR